MSLTDFDELVQEFMKDNPIPIKPPRVWVSALKGIPTKRGRDWIIACRDWDTEKAKFVLKRWQEETGTE